MKLSNAKTLKFTLSFYNSDLRSRGFHIEILVGMSKVKKHFGSDEVSLQLALEMAPLDLLDELEVDWESRKTDKVPKTNGFKVKMPEMSFLVPGDEDDVLEAVKEHLEMEPVKVALDPNDWYCENADIRCY